ncbi:MAG: hypothetical protein KDD45_01090 [Bdellovibrionales bacterium]|nr:hypothetical protein [Bdellovibrionales bacterium]
MKIEDIESRFEEILGLTGEQSFVDWETFTKNSTKFSKTLEELAKNIAILKEVQHKKFIQTMKKLKAADVPDLIKTVKAKKLPSQALRAIASRFSIADGKLQLTTPVD